MKKNLLTGACILCLLSGLNILTLSADTLAHYPFDGNSQDFSGNKLHGTSYNTAGTIDRALRTSCALLFNGTTSYVKLGQAFDLPQRSVSLWFKSTGITSDGDVIYGSDNPNLVNGLTIISLIKSGMNRYIRFMNGVNKVEVAVNENVWNHAVICCSTDSFRCYLNGVYVGANAHSAFCSPDGETVAVVGASRKTNTYLFTGSIDDIYIFNNQLSHQDVTKLFNSNPLSISESIDNDNYMFYQVSENLVITSASTTRVNIRFIDLSGKTMLTENIDFKDNSTRTLDIGILGRAVYLVVFEDKNKNIRSYRFIKH